MAVAPAARASGFLAKLTPGLVTAALILPAILPWGVPGYNAVGPDFLLLSAYYWTLYRPADLSYLLLFAAGLLFDLLTTGPLGLTPLLLLVVRGIMLNRRRLIASLGFSALWLGFSVAALGVSTTRWLVGSAFTGQILDIRDFVFQTVLTVACYPLFSLLMARLQRIVGA